MILTLIIWMFKLSSQFIYWLENLIRPMSLSYKTKRWFILLNILTIYIIYMIRINMP